MFAIVFSIYAGLSKLYNAIRDNVLNHMYKSKAIKSGKKAYWDTRGAYRLVSNDKQIRYVTLKNGDRTIQTLDGNILRNITKEDRNKEIARRNSLLSKDGVKLIGRFCDVCEDKMNKGIWKHIPKKAAVFADDNNVLYFREPTHGKFKNPYAYIRVEDGKYIMLGNTSNAEKRWLHEKNSINAMRSFIHLDRTCEYCR